MERVLITGGAGFIGSHLVDDLQQDYDVYVLDNYRTGKRENIKSLADDHVFELDIREYDAVEQIMKTYQFDYVIHLAALVSVAESVEKPILSQEINVVATLRLLEIIKKYNSHIKRFIFASSAAVYGDLPDLPKSDQSLILPLSPYAIDKYYGERTTLNFLMYLGQDRILSHNIQVLFQRCSIHLSITSHLHFLVTDCKLEILYMYMMLFNLYA